MPFVLLLTGFRAEGFMFVVSKIPEFVNYRACGIEDHSPTP